MPPKKHVPPPQSDESGSSSDGREEKEEEVEDPRKKSKKKPKRRSLQKKANTSQDEQDLQKNVDKMFDGSDWEDDGSDLFALVILTFSMLRMVNRLQKEPEPPQFLTRTEQRRDRLMILNVEVNNFKSYEGKASIGPFHKSFTSIIGPNGSGKSNLIDSLLFVFGFRASKIRSTKVSNLIHSSAHHVASSCTVTIHFQRIIDDGDRYQVVPDSNFEISRTAYKNGSSNYAIDGRAASKGEVEARLREVDIDIEHNRFLILQGEVEQIAMMKPVKATKSEVGMVEYLEDIIGSNRLEPLVRKFEKRVNRLNCEVSQQRIARDHARSSKVAMEGPVRQAVEFLMIENEQKTVQMKLDQRRRKRFLDKVAPLQAEIETKRDERKTLGEQLEANKNEFREAEKQEKALTDQCNKLGKEVDTLSEQIRDLNNEEKTRKDNLKKKVEEIAKIEVERDKELKKKTTLIAAPEKAEKKIKKCKEEVEQLIEIEEKANEEADKNLEEFEKRSQSQKEEQRTIQETWSKHNTELNKIRSAATVARDEYEDLTRMANSGTKQLDDMVARLATAEEEYKKQDDELKVLGPQKDEWVEKFKNLSTNYPNLRNQVREKQRELAVSQEKLTTISQQNTRFTSGRDIVQRLMKEKDEGRIRSFVGRLGDLGVIDKQYDRCITTNYGGMLNHLVCHTLDDASRVIEYLKRHELPKHTVISMQTTGILPHHYAPVPHDRYPGPRLLDLIDCDPEVRPAFCFVLGKALVAKTLAEAIQFNRMPACRGMTIVTLDGTMVSPNGNVTGGASRTGALSTDKSRVMRKVTEEERAAEYRLIQQVNNLKAEFAALKTQEQEMDREFMEARSKSEDLTKRVTMLQTCITKEQSTIKTLRKTVESQKVEAAKVKVDAKTLEEKKKNLEELEKKRDELGEEAGKVEKRQSEIQSKLDSLFKELVQCHRDQAKEALQKRQKLEKEMAKENTSITLSARNIAKCEDNIARLEREIESANASLDDLKKPAADEATMEAKEAELKVLKDKKAEADKEITELTKKQSAMSAAETQLEEDLSKCDEAIKELKNKMAADKVAVHEIDKKLAAMKVNRIPRFQFLTESSRPEDVPMQFNDVAVDENQTPEEVERQKRQLANKMTDDAYAREFEMRQRVLENAEKYSDVDECLRFIGQHLVAVYKMLTDGGDAKLEYIDKDDPFKSGISFMVRPAKKAWKQIQFLSGGEKTLSSLALIFALHMFSTFVRILIMLHSSSFLCETTCSNWRIVSSESTKSMGAPRMSLSIHKKFANWLNISRIEWGKETCTLPDEVSRRFNETISRQNKELTAREKQYPNFPSSSEISKAEKIVSVEGRVRKELNHTDSSSRPQSKASDMPSTSRSDSRANQFSDSSAPHASERPSSQRTPRKERHTDADEVCGNPSKLMSLSMHFQTTPPVKRSNSTTTTTSTRSPRRNLAGGGTAERQDDTLPLDGEQQEQEQEHEQAHEQAHEHEEEEE
ncbi:hypothetical protein CAEBREN_29581 [Caenorhabditis brenneri]|uniref:SMC hinge domain-containing protein n=1 Tax=Caenorhabditis brenneri TaxID=135651 RepID=G0MEB1_CAEBE|nr:hypothetical protein CAEBREN_29581 [Caenorhabditis brenneri]